MSETVEGNAISSTAAAMRRQDDMLDDLAAGVARLKDQTHAIHDEAHAHIKLLEATEENVDIAKRSLEEEAMRAMRLKEEGSVIRLSSIVAGLSILLFLLILIGLS